MPRALLVAAALAVTACGVTRERLVGEYFDQVGNDGSLSLTLSDDETYVQRFKPKRGPEIETRGRWEFNTARGTIVVHDFQPRIPGVAETKRDWLFEPEEDWGMVRLWSGSRSMYLGAKRR